MPCSKETLADQTEKHDVKHRHLEKSCGDQMVHELIYAENCAWSKGPLLYGLEKEK